MPPDFITPKAINRFNAKVDKDGPLILDTPCWMWTGAMAGRGYGVVTIGGQGYYAHRIAYAMANGPFADDLFVLHRCDTPPCVRPDHLFLGTHESNMEDMASKGRNQYGVWHHGAKLGDDDVRDIRRKAAEGVAQRALAMEYDLTPVTIWEIVHHRLWRHVDPVPDQPGRRERVGYAKGGQHGRAKLTEEQVREIRRRYVQGRISQEALGKEYGVHQTQIGQIVRREKWADLD